MRINLALCLCLACTGTACRVDGRRPGLSRAWPELGTMLSAAAWGADSARVLDALDAAHDSVERVDSLLQHHVRFAAVDSIRRVVRERSGVALPGDSLAYGYALDRAAAALHGRVDSALLDLGGQYYWVGPADRPTHRAVGIPDPDNTLGTLAVVDLQNGSLRTQSQRDAPRGGARSVTVLAPRGLDANAWAAAFLALGCDSALSLARQMSAVCADSSGVRWATGLQNRVSLPAAPAP